MEAWEMYRQTIVTLLETTRRKGIHKLIEYMDNNGFFHAPCSKDHHNNFVGGLAKHSLDVYRLLQKKVNESPVWVNRNSTIIAALLHDLCKIDEYHWSDEEEGWIYDTATPLGHGAKSIFLAQQYIKLTVQEAAMIRWHMGGWEPGLRFDNILARSYRVAERDFPEVILIHHADNEAAKFYSRKGSESYWGMKDAKRKVDS